MLGVLLTSDQLPESPTGVTSKQASRSSSSMIRTQRPEMQSGGISEC